MISLAIKGGEFRADIPRSHCHWTGGYAWGTSDHRAHELALNILTLYLEPTNSMLQDGTITNGRTLALVPLFVHDFLCLMPRSGGTLEGAKIRAWIKRRRKW